MTKNMGTIDRSLRITVAIVIATLYLTKVTGGVLGLTLIIVGAAFALTGFVGICPLYLPFGISTLKKAKQ